MRSRPARTALAAAAATLAGLLVPAGPGTAAALPTVSVVPAQAVASSRASELPVQVKLSAVTTVPVTVGFTEQDGTALAGKDYTLTTGTATVPAGARSVTVKIPLLPGLAFGQGAADRVFTVVLSAPVGATPGTMSATAAIHPNGYLSARAGNLRQAVFDPTSRLAYISNIGLNQVEVLNTRTGTYLPPIPVGSAPYGLDVTPDGKQLYVCNSGGQNISVVDIATRRVIRTIATPLGGVFTQRAFSIAIGGNGHALFTVTTEGSSFVQVYDLTLATGTYVPFTGFDFGTGPGKVTNFTRLFRSADRSHLLGVDGNISNGPFFVHDTVGGGTTTGTRTGFNTFGALDRRGTVALLDGTFVMDPVTGALRGTVVSPGVPGFPVLNGPGVLNNAGTIAYRLEEGAIGVIDVARFLRVRSFPMGDATLSGRYGLAISPDSRTLVALTASGAVVVRL